MSKTLPLLFAAALVLGCPPKDDTGTDTPEADTDTDSDADTDSDTDADTDADADADTDADTDAAMSFLLEGELEGATFAMSWAWPQEDGYLEGDVLHVAELQGERLEIGELEVPKDHLVELAPDHFPGLYAAMYVPTLFDDADADLQVDEGEIIVGAGLVWPLWVEGDVPAEAALVGIEAGWNHIDYSVPDTVSFGNPYDLPVQAGLWPIESITIGGELADEDELPVRLSVRAGQQSKDGTLEVMPDVAPLADIELEWGAKWSLTIDGPPPEDHFDEHGESGWRGSLEFLRLYHDSDGSGGYSDGDELNDAICLEGEGAYLEYSEALTSPTKAFYYAWVGMPVGWAVLTGTDPETWVIMDDTQASGLGHCEVEEGE